MTRTGQVPRTQPPDRWDMRRYSGGADQRPLRIAIDRRTVRDDDVVDVLLEFGEHEAVEILSTDRADGVGVIEVEPYKLRTNVGITVSLPNKKRTQRTFAEPYPFWEELAAAAPGSKRDNVAALFIGNVACRVGVDALVTSHRYLLDSESTARRFVTGVNPMPATEAVALLGLHLRHRNDYTFSGGISTDRETYFDVLTDALMPAQWRWLGACFQSLVDGNADAPVRLAQSTLTRVNRALNARDRLHEQYLASGDGGTVDEANAQLDTVLQQLSGAFDAVARVAHRVYGLPGSPNVVDWAWKWRTNKLAREDSHLAALMDHGRTARDTFDVIAMLRNTIHGEALQRASHRTLGGPSIDGFVAPSDKMAEVLRIARRRGGLDRWGIKATPFQQQTFIIVPDRFVEALMPDAIRALNRLMRKTEVTRLPGVDASSLRQRPPDVQRDLVLNRWTHRRFRLLAGL